MSLLMLRKAHLVFLFLVHSSRFHWIVLSRKANGQYGMCHTPIDLPLSVLGARTQVNYISELGITKL